MPFVHGLVRRSRLLVPLSILLAVCGVQDVATAQAPAGADGRDSAIIAVAGFAGGSFPVGDFADLSGGGAKLGFIAGLNVVVRAAPAVGWLSTIAGAVNRLDTTAVAQAYPGASVDAGSWGTIWLLSGLELRQRLSESLELAASGQIGLLYAMRPDVSSLYGDFRYRVEGSSSSSFAFGIGCGVLVNSTYELDARFVRGTPHNRFPFAEGGKTGDEPQPIGLFLFTGAIFF